MDCFPVTLFAVSLYPTSRAERGTEFVWICFMPTREELPIIQRMYDLILWYVPRLNKLPRDYPRSHGPPWECRPGHARHSSFPWSAVGMRV